MTAPDLLARTDELACNVGRCQLTDYAAAILDRAESLSPETLTVRHFHAAGLTIEAQFSNPDLARSYAARLVGERAEIDNPPPDLRVSLIETSRLDWPPLARWRDPGCDRRCFEETLDAAGFRAVYPGSSRCWEVMRRSPPASSVQVVASDRDRPPWDGGAPLRIPIHWLSLDRGEMLTHAATLGRHEEAALLVGPGGVGKSATVLAGIAKGLHTAGDDHVMVTSADCVIARPVYRFFKQDRKGVNRIPGLSEKLAGYPLNWQGKLEFAAEDFFPGCIASRQVITAIVVPVVAQAERSRIEPIGANAVLSALLRSNIGQFPGRRQDIFQFCARLSRQLPGFRLLLSGQADEIADTIDGLFEVMTA